MRNWTHRAGRMEVGRGRGVLGPRKAGAGGTRDGTSCFTEKSPEFLAQRGLFRGGTRGGREVERHWPVGRDTLFHQEHDPPK